VVTSLVHSVHSEWLKQRRSMTRWLVLAGGMFVPVILFLIRARRRNLLPAMHESDTFWTTLWNQSWNSMSTVFLPMFIIVAVSVIIQIESRNNAWKQLHASPQPLPIIFFAKLTIILLIVVELFAVFNVGIYVSGVLPVLLFKGVGYPVAPLPVALFLKRNLVYFIDGLPIVAMQYLLSLRFRNVMVPIGIGMAMWFIAIVAISSDYNYLLPYGYCAMSWMRESNQVAQRSLPANVPTLACGWFVTLTAIGLVAYVSQTDRG
jgi:lantibiotic transport system permease protein